MISNLYIANCWITKQPGNQYISITWMIRLKVSEKSKCVYRSSPETPCVCRDEDLRGERIKILSRNRNSSGNPYLYPPKINMKMEKQPFEDACPIKNVDVSMSILLSGVWMRSFHPNPTKSSPQLKRDFDFVKKLHPQKLASQQQKNSQPKPESPPRPDPGPAVLPSFAFSCCLYWRMSQTMNSGSREPQCFVAKLKLDLSPCSKGMICRFQPLVFGVCIWSAWAERTWVILCPITTIADGYLPSSHLLLFFELVLLETSLCVCCEWYTCIIKLAQKKRNHTKKNTNKRTGRQRVGLVVPFCDVYLGTEKTDQKAPTFLQIYKQIYKQIEEKRKFPATICLIDAWNRFSKNSPKRGLHSTM